MKQLIFFLLFIITTTSNAQVEVSLTVNGRCGMCEDRIESAALSVEGVKSAKWNVNTQILTIKAKETFDENILHIVLASVGHSTNQMAAVPFVYNNLPACCKYADEDEDDSNTVFGSIEEQTAKKKLPVFGANVYWLGTTIGATTDESGEFNIPMTNETAMLIVSYIGYENDTIDMLGQKAVNILLNESVNLSEVEITYRKKATEISFFDPIKVENITTKELLRAACCNLSESFETSPSIDVSFTDAITGTRQIQMLGLAGPYVQLTRENMPDIRGLSAIYGFTYTPGHWIKGIQLNKGTGSVVNGFESITGQINVELKQPQDGELTTFNLYANEGGRIELNADIARSLGKNWSTSTLVHSKINQVESDRNTDGFLDNPLEKHLILANRWKFFAKNGIEGQFGVKGTFTNHTSGQLGVSGETPFLWGTTSIVKRLDAWYKTGIVFQDRPTASIGLQLGANYHDQESTFGVTNYDANQQSLYANLIFQDVFSNTNHTYKTGISFQYDDIEEVLEVQNFERQEAVPGAFFEYTYTYLETFSLVAGLRADHHNIFGAFVTPRLHLRYAPTEKTVLRASAGRGQRTASILSENIGMFASARSIKILGTDDPKKPYGLDAESAWNFGINASQEFPLGDQTMSLGVDLYHTRFNNQIVVDYENPREVLFYNLDGASFSNSLQIQLDAEIAPRLEVRIAYRFNDVKTQYLSGLKQKPLIARHRSFINLSYETESNWKFNFTLNRQGSKRITSTTENPVAYQIPDESPAFFLANAQITKVFNEKLDIYLGGENIFNFSQSSPIIAPAEPYSEFFDASMIWGPVFGRNIYAGLRLNIAKE